MVRGDPDWLELAENEKPDHKFGFTISILNPVKDIFLIEIWVSGESEGLGIRYSFDFLNFISTNRTPY